MKNTCKYLLLLCSLLTVPFIGSKAAYANISLDKVVVRFLTDGRPVKNVTVSNQGDKPIKVTSKVIQVMDSGLESETEEETRELSLAPKNFELAPGEKRIVRLVLKKFPEDLEGIYRVRFTPEDPTEVQEIDSAGGTSVKVNIVTAMGMLILAAPQNPKVDLAVSRADGVITVTNNGNVTAQLEREDFCLKDKTCVPLNGKRVYPGASWSFDVPEALKGKEFKQTVLMNGGYSTLNFPVQ